MEFLSSASTVRTGKFYADCQQIMAVIPLTFVVSNNRIGALGIVRNVIIIRSKLGSRFS